MGGGGRMRADFHEDEVRHVSEGGLLTRDWKREGIPMMMRVSYGEESCDKRRM